VRALFTSIVLAGLIHAAPAAAQPIEDTYSVAIPYGDLNLTSIQGRMAFDARVKAAADTVCLGFGVTPLEQAVYAKKCRDNFTRTAGQQLQLASAPAGGLMLAAR
jgi:UrcA family protein